MGKIRILKTSYLKRKIKEYIIKLSLVDYKLLRKKKESKNLLIIILDTLGDNIVKSKTIEILTNEFWKKILIYYVKASGNLFMSYKIIKIFLKMKLNGVFFIK